MSALAIEIAVNESVTLLHCILRAINNVRQFRRQCVELGNMVALLLVMMEADHPIESGSVAGSSVVAKPSAFSEANTSVRLKATLDETHAFITKCIGEWNIWQRGWEVIVTRKLPRLKQDLFEWITLCMLETSVSRACSTSYNLNLTAVKPKRPARRMNCALNLTCKSKNSKLLGKICRSCSPELTLPNSK